MIGPAGWLQALCGVVAPGVAGNDRAGRVVAGSVGVISDRGRRGWGGRGVRSLRTQQRAESQCQVINPFLWVSLG